MPTDPSVRSQVLSATASIHSPLYVRLQARGTEAHAAAIWVDLELPMHAERLLLVPLPQELAHAPSRACALACIL